jgi:hypothetical protein
MLSACAALLVLLGMGWTGATLLRKLDAGLESLEVFAYVRTVKQSVLLARDTRPAGPFRASAAWCGA